MVPSEIRRSPVEVGSWNPIIYRFFLYIPRFIPLDGSEILQVACFYRITKCVLVLYILTDGDPFVSAILNTFTPP